MCRPSCPVVNHQQKPRICASAAQIAEEAEAGGGPLPLPTTTKVHNNYAILLMELGRPRQVRRPHDARRH
jgi:hypothetical protein